jgi:hypothetical protein
MKQIILSIAIALSGILSAHAQCYIGGSLNLNVSSQSVEQLNKKANPSYSFSLSPEIGYSINEKMDIGLSFSMGFSSSKTSSIGMSWEGMWEGITQNSKTESYQINPYFRYSFLKWKKFNLLGEADVYAGINKIKYEYSNVEKDVRETKQTSWGANIHPVLIYNLSDKWALLSHLNFFRFGFSKIKTNTDSPVATDVVTGFSLGLTTENLLPSIGLIYKF